MEMILEWLYSYSVGTSYITDLLYSVLSLLVTGEVMEDSLFWTV